MLNKIITLLGNNYEEFVTHRKVNYVCLKDYIWDLINNIQGESLSVKFAKVLCAPVLHCKFHCDLSMKGSFRYPTVKKAH